MVAFGKVFPTKDGDTLHTVIIGESDFAKVCFDDVSNGCEELPLPLSPNDELTTMISTLTPQIKEPTTVAAKTRALVGMQNSTSKIGLPAVEAKGTHTPVDMTTPKEFRSAQSPLPRRKQIKFHQCLQLL